MSMRGRTPSAVNGVTQVAMSVAETSSLPSLTTERHRAQVQTDFKRGSSFVSSRAAAESARDIRRTAHRGVRGPGRKLPYFETVQRAFGDFDLSGVRAYTGTAAVDANQAIGAAAYAMGDRVAFASRRPTLGTVAHEAAHVVQQSAGVHLAGGVGREGDAYERHAEAVADAVTGGGAPAGGVLQEGLTSRAGGATGPQVQMLIEIGKEPANPAAFRTTTTLTAPGGVGFGGPGGAAVHSDRDFTPGQTGAIRLNNNMNAGPGPLPVAAAPAFDSDASGNGLLSFAAAAQVSPELDHIVPKAIGGSNSINNGRILSAQENNVGPVPRPAATLAQTAIKLYHAYTITHVASGGVMAYPAGATLTIGQASEFWQYANGGGPPLANTAAFTRARLNTIVAAPTGGAVSGGFTVV